MADDNEFRYTIPNEGVPLAMDDIGPWVVVETTRFKSGLLLTNGGEMDVEPTFLVTFAGSHVGGAPYEPVTFAFDAAGMAALLRQLIDGVARWVTT